jgi:hypothetical protein
LRSGGITAAYAVGVPLERIMRLSNHASLAVVMRHYLDDVLTCWSHRPHPFMYRLLLSSRRETQARTRIPMSKDIIVNFLSASHIAHIQITNFLEILFVRSFLATMQHAASFTLASVYF